MQGLAFFRYEATAQGRAAASAGATVSVDLQRGIDFDWVAVQPVLYEDFLPVSAAGIFQSNLGGAEQAAYQVRSSREHFEEALGTAVIDPFELYATIERESIRRVETILSLCSKFSAVA